MRDIMSVGRHRIPISVWSQRFKCDCWGGIRKVCVT